MKIKQKHIIIVFSLAAWVVGSGCSESSSSPPDLGPVKGRAFWSPQGIASHSRYILVANSAHYLEAGKNRYGAGFVTVIDRKTRAVVSRVPTSAPNTVDLVLRGDRAWVLSSGTSAPKDGVVQATSAGALDLIELSAGPPRQVSRSIALGVSQHDARVGAYGSLVLDPAGKLAYLGSGTRGDVFAVDLAAGKLLRGPDNPVVLFATKSGQNGMAIVRPWGSGLAVLDFNTENLCLSSDWGGSLAHKTCHSIKVHKDLLAGPVDLARAPDGSALVLMTLANALYRVDVATSPFRLLGKLASTGLANNRMVMHDGEAIIVNSLSANVQSVDAQSGASKLPLSVLPSQSNPYDLTITRETEGDVAWVTLFKAHRLALVNLQSGAVIGTIGGQQVPDAGSPDAGVTDGPSSDRGTLDAAALDARQKDEGVDSYILNDDGMLSDFPWPLDGGGAVVGASKVQRQSYGKGAGFGQSSLPAVIQGGPRGEATGGGSTDVLSLGEGGEVVLSFGPYDIVDGPGPDFIVFENPLSLSPYISFAEPAIIALSAKTDQAADFVNFPCDLNKPNGNPATKTWAYPGCAGVRPVYANVKSNTIPPTDPVKAGGDPFDLKTIGLRRARYLRIRDAGVSKLGTDSKGFDLDAVVLLHYIKR